MKKLTHINQKGVAQLVDITDKAITHRKAIAEGSIKLNKETRSEEHTSELQSH